MSPSSSIAFGAGNNNESNKILEEPKKDSMGTNRREIKTKRSQETLWVIIIIIIIIITALCRCITYYGNIMASSKKTM